jgi:hypothetical protein
MTSLTIPADVVGILRNALHTEIGQDASEIVRVSEDGHGDLHAEVGAAVCTGPGAAA